MTDIEGAGINAKKYQIYIGSTSNEWKLLQNASLNMGHAVFKEPTTSGGNLLYTGSFDGTISGSLLFSRNTYLDTNGIEALLTVGASTGEVPANDWIVKFTDTDGTSTNTTLTFTNCKLSVVGINKSAEGATKIDITVVCPSFATKS